MKAREAADLRGLPALADDSGLCVDALHGRPGIFSARWAEDEDGNRDWMRAMEKVWREAEATEPDAAPAAHFACALAIAWPNDGQAETFDGRVDGTLVWPPRGDKGFGYDPMFVPVGHDQTFGEMEPDVKHGISHRADAFRKLRGGAARNERRAARALRPLAVLRQQMPLLRLQQPCPRDRSTRTQWRERCSPTSRMKRGCCPAGR